MNIKPKQFLATLLSLAMILTSVPITAYATDVEIGDGAENEGTGGSTDGSTDSLSSWGDSKQGYRFVIADQNLQPISNIVDITFSQPNTGEGYYNSRLTSLSQDEGSLGYKIDTWDNLIAASKSTENQIDTPPPAAMGWIGGNPVAQGLAFKDWFMGTDEFVGGTAPPAPSGGGGGTGGGTTGGTGGGTGGSGGGTGGGTESDNYVVGGDVNPEDLEGIS